ncbi:hypothetical protein HGB07_04485 [Candidatus Roizmanbacteria bacterium]|nr:hypothetical protein [Candidatus Roizmanbacteria bacterium]
MDMFSMDTANQIWNSMKQHNWPGFQQAIDENRDKMSGVPGAAIDQVKNMAGTFEKTGRPFPDSPQELMDLFKKSVNM